MAFKKIKKALPLAWLTVMLLLLSVELQIPRTLENSEGDDSAELIIGIENKPNCKNELIDVLEKYDVECVRTISTGNMVVAELVKIQLTSEASSFVEEIHTCEFVRYIEPNARFKAFKLEPNDPDWATEDHQWGYQKIKANWAWNTTTGSKSILVAFIDTGINYTHEDLVANYVPLGYDWVNDDNDTRDDVGHGTHVAGILGAEINNEEGIAGLAQIRIMVEKAGDSEGWMYVADFADAIIHAVDQDADVISISAGHYFRSKTVYDAIKYAYNAGVLLVAAAGNEYCSGRLYPAAFNEVIAVTATDKWDKPWWEKDQFGDYYGTNFGNWVELAAPGVKIWSTSWDPDTKEAGYGYGTGTSASAPYVAGVAALVWSHFPNMTRDQLRVHLWKTAVDLGDSGCDEDYGYGRIDANASVSQTPPSHDLLVFSWEKPSYVEIGKLVKVSATVLNYGTSDESDVVVKLLVNGTVEDSKTISSLTSGSSSTVMLSWTPWVERDFNLSTCVVPVNGETATEDNGVWARVTHEAGVIRVPQLYSTIQEAVDAATPGDTILVSTGDLPARKYKETVNIYKDGLKIIGEGKDKTFVSGENKRDQPTLPWVFAVVDVRNVLIKGFRIMGAIGEKSVGFLIKPSGILFHVVWNSTIAENTIEDNLVSGGGITLSIWSRYNTITNNMIKRNYIGIRLEWVFFDWNIIKGNYIYDNYKYGMELYKTKKNLIYHNNFDDNTDQITKDTLSSNQWFGRWNVTGNYWNDYQGVDDGSNNRTAEDGVGDTEIPHRKVDDLPLMGRWLPGDVTHDGKVSAADFARLSCAWNKTSNDPDWLPWHAHADLNEDGIVDELDYEILIENYGKTWQDYWFS